MKSFETWYKDLIENYVWAEPAMMHHKPETFKKICHKVYMNYTAGGGVIPIEESRKHVYNLIVKTPGDKPKWHEVALKKIEEEKSEEEKEWVPLTGEERQRRIAEFKAMVDSAPKILAAPKLSSKEIAEEGGWLPKKEKPFVRSEFEIQLAVEEHNRKVYEARRKLFLDCYPDASEEEVKAYIEKFSAI